MPERICVPSSCASSASTASTSVPVKLLSASATVICDPRKASQITVADALNNFTGTDVEAVLAELAQLLGTQILSGIGPPLEDTGTTGDYYVDVDGQVFYGP